EYGVATLGGAINALFEFLDQALLDINQLLAWGGHGRSRGPRLWALIAACRSKQSPICHGTARINSRWVPPNKHKIYKNSQKFHGTGRTVLYILCLCSQPPCGGEVCRSLRSGFASWRKAPVKKTCE